MLKNEKLGLIEESEEDKTLIIKSKIKTFRGIMLEYIEKLVEKYGQDPWNEDDIDYKMMELAREMHIAPCKLNKILAGNDVEILKKRGYKLWQGNFGWQHMPIGSLFTTSQKDCIRCKKGETFSESEVVGA